MDAFFSLPQAVRAEFLLSLLQSFGCTYACLWQYDSDISNRLFFLDGLYDAVNNQLSSSLWSVAETLFHQYRSLTFDVHDGCVPGVSFRNHLPYLALQRLDLLRLTSHEIQAQFFQEARIEMAIFMGSKKGEIELGFSILPQVDIQTALKNLFPEDFNVHSQSTPYQINPHSSSSSFRSLPSGTPDQCSSLGVVPTQTRRYQLAQVIPSFFPTPEGEHEAIVRALIRVISSPNSSSTSEQHQPHQILPNSDTAFTRYTPVIISTPHMGSNFHSQNLQNRLSAFFKNLNFMRMGQHNIIQEARPVSAQKHHLHTISERRRREKLNESFQELIALLPAGPKKNKASILTTAKDTMRSLMDEIEKLNVRNQQLMKTVLTAKEGSSSSSEEHEGSSSKERLNVRVSHEPECSSSEERMVKLQVTMRGESCQVDVLIRLLEFLKGVQNVNLTSMVANHITGDTAINQLTFRLRIVKGSEWEERGFEEAVRRVVGKK